MAQETVTTVDELSEGDTLHIQGNGVDTTRTVNGFKEGGWGDSMTRALLSSDDVTFQIKAKRASHLSTGKKMHLVGHGTVEVTRA